MQYARKLRKGDKVAIVSLSSGMLGEEFCICADLYREQNKIKRIWFGAGIYAKCFEGY